MAPSIRSIAWLSDTDKEAVLCDNAVKLFRRDVTAGAQKSHGAKRKTGAAE